MGKAVLLYVLVLQHYDTFLVSHVHMVPRPPPGEVQKAMQFQDKGCLQLFNLLDAGCLEAINYFHGLRRIP